MYALFHGVHGRRAAMYASVADEHGLEARITRSPAAEIAARGAPALILVEALAADSFRELAQAHAAAPGAPAIVVSAFSALREMAWSRRDAFGIVAVVGTELDLDSLRATFAHVLGQDLPEPDPTPTVVAPPALQLDVDPQLAVDRLAEALGHLLGASTVLVEVSVTGRQVVGRHGPGDERFLALVRDQPLGLPDLADDPRADADPQVRAGLVRALRGVPLVGPAGNAVGTLAVGFARPRDPDLAALEDVARAIGAQLDHAVHSHWPAVEAERMAQEVAELQEANASVGATLRTLAVVLDHLDEGVMLCSARGEIRMVNGALADFLGVDRATLQRATRATLPGPDTMRPVRRAAAGSVTSCEIGLVHPRRILEWSTRPVALPEGTGQLDTFRDVTDLVDLRATQEHLALTDELTDLANRRGGENVLRREIARSRRAGVPLAVVLFDIDHFKSVNDRFGHASGDEVLCVVARTLSGTLRGSDIAVRWGGEEMLAILPGIGAAGARVAAEHVRAAVAARELGEVGHVTVSGGVAELEAGDDEVTLVARADAMLYEAKSAGRNCTRG